MFKTVHDLAAEIAQDVIKARGEAIDGQKELIETYLRGNDRRALFGVASMPLKKDRYMS
jgi:hypothetical protein